MPDKEFLETYPLYRKLKIEWLPATLDILPKININMPCPKCASNQTFLMANEYFEAAAYMNFPSAGAGLRLEYLCTHCQKFKRLFFVKIDDNGKWLMKIGQYPAWEVKAEPNVERLLGKHAAYFKRGLVCESQGYGIGAFGYYRRIIEEIIDDLLDEIRDLLSGEELSNYQRALAQTKKTTVTQDKIDLVKELLPEILRPGGMNPLSVLHSTLSEGLHAESDEACLEYAEACRKILVFLVNQVAASKETSKEFTESMKKLLDKKSKK
jgi:hypothetical protein